MITTRLNGAPLYGPAKYTLPGTYVNGTPTPVPTWIEPISEEAGQEGLAISSAPRATRDLCLHDARVGALATPAIFAETPGGIVRASWENSWSSSVRVRRRKNGEKEPRRVESVPADSDGPNGRSPRPLTHATAVGFSVTCRSR